MQIWQDEDQFTQAESGGCCGLSAVDDARRVADRLEIPYYVMNFKREFKKNVMDYFTAEYLKGRTPNRNPCFKGVWRSEPITLRPATTRAWNSFPTEDMLSATP